MVFWCDGDCFLVGTYGEDGEVFGMVDGEKVGHFECAYGCGGGTGSGIDVASIVEVGDNGKQGYLFGT